jgi:hypothetical protein
MSHTIEKIKAYYATQTRPFAEFEEKVLIESLSAIEKNPDLGTVVLRNQQGYREFDEFCRSMSFYQDLSGFQYHWWIGNLKFILVSGADAFLHRINQG